MTTLTKGEYMRGVAEAQTRFVVRCTACQRMETRSPLPSAMDLVADQSPSAGRLRATCRQRAPLPCTFEHKAELLNLTHAQALDAGLVESVPLLRLEGDDGEVMIAARLNRPPTLVEVVAIAELAQKALEQLKGSEP